MSEMTMNEDTGNANPMKAHALKKIPLDALHRELGAKFGGFAGFEMPIQYPAGLKQEHLATRAQAGLFDVSHMGQLRITPKDGLVSTLHAELEAALPVDFQGWPTGLQRYSLLINEQGGIEDDLMLVNLGSSVVMVVNAGNRDQDFAFLTKLCPGLNFSWVDASLIALQGPAAESILASLDPQVLSMRFMEAKTLSLGGATCFATRSGYTGEDGFEISIPSQDALRVVRGILADTRVQPVGLAARDTLRLEAGLPLHGNDISGRTSPIEAGLNFSIPKSRRLGGEKAGDFPGASIILRQLEKGVNRKLVGLISDENIPIRAHSQVFNADNEVVGEVVSGTVSPTLGKPIMMAYIRLASLPDKLGQAGEPLYAAVRDKRPSVRFVALPFVEKRYKR
jgi:aminomethyltransferase